LQKEVLFEVFTFVWLRRGCKVQNKAKDRKDIDQQSVNDQNELHYFKVHFAEQETDA